MQFHKTIILTTLLLSLDLIAQPGIGSAKSLIKLEFEDIYGLKISHPEVSLDIDTVEKFNSGTHTNWLNSHLIVTGVKSYELTIKTIQSNFLSSNLETNVAVSNVRVNARTNTKSTTVFLSDSSQILISENNGSMVNYIDVKYEIPSENTFAFISNTTNIFETLIIYTLIPN